MVKTKTNPEGIVEYPSKGAATMRLGVFLCSLRVKTDLDAHKNRVSLFVSQILDESSELEFSEVQKSLRVLLRLPHDSEKSQKHFFEARTAFNYICRKSGKDQYMISA